MKKLKLLLIMRDFSRWGNPKQYYLAQELAKITDLVIWYHEGNIQSILKQIRFTPDFILIMFYKSHSRISPPITGLNTLNIPFGVFVMDLHNLSGFKKGILEDNVQHIFASYRDSFYERFPEFVDRMIWLPQHVPTNLFKDYRQKKDIDLLMMGHVHPTIYPLRYQIKQTLANRPDFTYHPPPRHRIITEGTKEFVRERYAKEINRAKLFFTCDSKFRYPILKYFEVPACRTLLLAPFSEELYDLGFRPEKNFIAIDKRNFLEKAEYYLRNDTKRQRITDEGFSFIHKHHSTEVRAKQLVDMIQNIVRSS